MKIRSLFSIMALSFGVSSVQAINYSPDNVSAELLLKVPGNDAVHHSLTFEKIQNSEYDYQLVGNKKLPLMLYQNIEGSDNCKRITMLVCSFRGCLF